MAGEQLHDYDLQLSDYVVGTIRYYMGKRSFANWVEEQVTFPALLNYIRAGLVPFGGQHRLLLTDGELEHLVDALDGGPLTLFREWIPSEPLHRRYLNTFTEVRDELSKQIAEDWTRDCGQFAARLEEKTLWLPQGIEIVREWIGRLRQLLRALGATAFLPCPEGQSPTPTNPAPADMPAVSSKLPTKEEMEIMRQAIAEHDRTRQSVPADRRGQNASPTVLTRIAEIRPQRARNALRELERLEEYSGFARRRPRRYLEGRRNEK